MLLMVKGICLILIMIVMPFLCGTIITKYMKKDSESVLLNWISGFILIMALVEVVVVPATFLKLSFRAVCAVCYVLVVAAAALGVVWNRKRIGQMCVNGVKSIRHTPVMIWLVLLLLLFQMAVYVFYMHEDADDAFYIGTALTAVEDNSLFQVNPYTGEPYKTMPTRYILSPFPIFNGMLSQCVRLHPAIIVHTILPVILVMFCYGVFAVLGMELFKNEKEKAGWLVFFTGLYVCYSGFSTSAQGSMMVLRIWQGKSVLAVALLPMILCIFLRIIKRKESKADWILLFGLMLACCMVSSMGIMLGAIMLGCCGMVAAAFRRSFLHLIKWMLCALPNMILAVIYILIR